MAGKANHDASAAAGTPSPGDRLTPREDALLKAAKEIAVKFIETGRLTVAAFNEQFPQIYRTLDATIPKHD